MARYKTNVSSDFLPKSRQIRGASLFALWLAASCFLASVAVCADPPSVRSIPMLRLVDGDYVTGNLTNCDQPDRLRWQSEAFASPFDFVLSGVTSVHFPLPGDRPAPTGAYCFELAGGDVLYGSLVGLSVDGAELDLPELGRVQLRRSALRRMVRWSDGADLVFTGLSGLESWDASRTVSLVQTAVNSKGPTDTVHSDELEMENDWREEGGHFATATRGASIYADLKVPKQAIFEFEISWSSKPGFVFALGVDNSKKSFEEAYRFEVWDNELVAVRETDADADVSAIGKLKAGAGRAHLVAYLDQERSRLLVHSADGKKLAEIQMPAAQSKRFPGVRLTNYGKDVRLERLRISHWNGDPPRSVQSGNSRIHRTDGSITYGQIQRLDTATRQFVVHGSGGASRIRSDAVGTIVFGPASNPKKSAIRVVMKNGVRLSGNLVEVEAGRLHLDCPGIVERLNLPIADLHALLVLEHGTPSVVSRDGRKGRLELNGVKLSGTLVDGGNKTDKNRLAWHPLRSRSAAPIRGSASGKIIYRVPPPPPKPKPNVVRRIRPQPRPAGIFGTLLGNADQKKTSKRIPTRSLHLRTGDTIPCRVAKIDTDGITFSTPMSDATFVSHDKVKAVELAGMSYFVKVSRSERDRLLTLPRMQKNNPPTHLIRSIRGDVLRCRLQEMDDKTLTADVRLEAKKIRRDRIAKIIWLHDDELNQSGSDATGNLPQSMRVQALRNDGIRLTFFPDGMADGILSGSSDVLGKCHVDLMTVDQLLIGGAIEEAAASLAYQKWKLHHATEPRFVSASDGANGHAPGTESAMVGQPAPDFSLTLLKGGRRFHLDAHKGDIIVLDFWASWCGPCVRAMPLVEAAVEQFKDQGVRLVTVNLQENPDQIKAMLERHRLSLDVAMDIDGAVAEKYAAAAIPQTVVIDRDGNIARLFVGGGPRIGEQLRDALETLVADE